MWFRDQWEEVPRAHLIQAANGFPYYLDGMGTEREVGGSSIYPFVNASQVETAYAAG